MDFQTRFCILTAVWWRPLAVAVFLSGCATEQAALRIDAHLVQEFTGDTQGACLARAYQAVVRQEARTYKNYRRAAAFLIRAEAAHRGEEVPIAAVERGQVSAQTFDDLAAAHGVLSTSIPRAAEGACACAQAQARFDAWHAALHGDALTCEKVKHAQAESYRVQFFDSLRACQGTHAPAARK